MAEKKNSVKIATALLKDANISLEERNELLTAVLDKLAILPLRDIINTDPNTGSLLLSGKEIDLEMAKKLRDGAKSLINNFTFKIIHEQVMFEAIQAGFLNAASEGQSLGGKMAIWWGKKEMEIISSLTQIGIIEDNK